MHQNNRNWADKVLKNVDPKFKHRWEIYNELLIGLMNSDSIWVDCGCGNNEMIKSYGHLVKKSIGIDLMEPSIPDGNFVKADIKKLPFPSGYADLITLRFVVEHFDAIDPYFSEITRVLKKKGKVIILTTNLISPLIYLPKILLPFPVKHKILTKLFKVDSEEIFPTYHKINKFERLKNVTNNLHLEHIEYISDLNYVRKWLFLILLSWHVLTLSKGMEKFRTNILAVFERI